MPMNFANQIALITGAGTGLGAVIARLLAAQGARCVLAGRRREPLESLASEIVTAGGAAEVVPADVSDAAQVEQLVARTVEWGGGLNIVVNGAGVFQMVPFEKTPLELFDQTLSVNLRGAFLVCQAAWPHLRAAGGGQIVNLSSISGVQAFRGNAAYGASKFGLNGLSAVLALEGRPHHIRVFAICPASIDTPIWDGQAPDDVRARMMKPEPIAEFVVHLLAAPPTLAFDPIIIRNFNDPWRDTPSPR
jgi:NAD(P)-dependent dehydrogenase (short-subunit alcohol dehydrogenase family)